MVEIFSVSFGNPSDAEKFVSRAKHITAESATLAGSKIKPENNNRITVSFTAAVNAVFVTPFVNAAKTLTSFIDMDF